MWAEAKAREGWKCSRTLFLSDSRIVGGWQLLWKSRFGLRVGYISRGPVIHSPDPSAANLLASRFSSLIRHQWISAVIVQSPVAAPDLAARFSQPPLMPYPGRGVITSTMVVDVSGGLAEVESGIRRRKLQEVRQALKRGVSVVEGSAKDLPAFFDLMLHTCERQETKPSPASLASLTALWKAFHPRGQIRLALAVHSAQPIAGWLSIGFGKKVTFFKTGWLSAAPGLHPISLLIHDGFAWAARNGFENCDFAGLDGKIADLLARGFPLSESERCSRDYYKTGFGGTPIFLPMPQLFVANPVGRFLLASTLRWRTMPRRSELCAARV